MFAYHEIIFLTIKPITLFILDINNNIHRFLKAKSDGVESP